MMVDTATPEMHPDFPRWHEAVGLGSEPERRAARWAGVSAVAGDGTSKNIEALLRLAFKTRHPAASASLTKIREAFKAADAGFEMKDNDREMQVLAGAALSQLMSRGGPAGAEAALSVTTAALSGGRKLNLPLDLAVLAEDAIDRLAEGNRKRPGLMSHAKTAAPKVDFEKAAAKIRETQNWESVAEALGLAADATSAALITMARRQANVVNALDDFVRIQDEELQMLWWLIGQRSEDFDCAFESVPTDAQALVFAKELAGHTEMLPGPSSIKGLLSRAGLKDRRKIALSAAIGAADPAWLNGLVPDREPSPVSTPIHYGIKRQLETGAGNAWVPGWAAAVGVSVTFALSSLVLGQLFYRERLLLIFGDE